MSYARLACVAILLSAFAMVGCHSGSSEPTPPPVAEKPKLPIPPDSPFAKVKLGMSLDEVSATIIKPTSVSSYITGKSFIPFHFSGSDTHRVVGHYKGIGTITYANDSAYSSGNNAISIDYDPNEPGYERNEPTTQP